LTTPADAGIIGRAVPSWSESRSTGFPRQTLVAAILLAAALVAWVVTYERMHGMDAGPGTDLGGLGWYVGIWVTMMGAMMLPSVAPIVMMFAKISEHRREQGRVFAPTWVFVAGYLIAWTVYGLAAYGLFRLLRWAVGGSLHWHGAGAWVAGGALVVGGLYQLTPLKQVCLRHCRGPVHFVLHDWRNGRLGALRMGVEHGAFCVGCCWGLMLALFALGVMSLVWMAVIAAIILVEKLLPAGEVFARVFAVAIVGAGIWVAAAPASVPGLVQPDSPAAQRARERMHMPGGMNKPMGTKPKPMG
jgi:predicted metal-binding membrane protein